MPPPSTAPSGAGPCATLQKSFLPPGPGRPPARTGGSAAAGTLRHTQLCGTTVSVLECGQALPPEHPAGMPGVLPSPCGCKPTSKGFISPIQPVPVPPSKTWLTSAATQPAQGCQAQVLTGVQPLCHTDAASVTSGAAAHRSGPACSAV